jgi:2-keto-4-pentenoate hydratase/2-oxohepta-3-ene-1,7-dioic acid hydratase in catechol pathway
MTHAQYMTIEERRPMKLLLFAEKKGLDLRPGLLAEEGVVDISSAVQLGHTPQLTMQGIIDGFESLRPALEKLAQMGEAIPVERVRLGPPLPRPGKIVNCIANYWEHAQREPRELNMFLKNPDAVVGPDDVIRLPEFTQPWAFMHEAELAIVFKGPSKAIAEASWREAVFGYTCLIDVTARGEGRTTWKRGSWLGKSFDTFAPIGPCIVTADEIPDPNNLHVQFWNNGQLRHNYNTDDMEHRVPELIAFVTSFMTMNSGDLLACGTNHEGLGFLQDGEKVEIQIHGIGKMSLDVVDPLKRVWERGIYMGSDSTHHDAVRRHRPNVVLKPSESSLAVTTDKRDSTAS